MPYFFQEMGHVNKKLKRETSELVDIIYQMEQYLQYILPKTPKNTHSTQWHIEVF